MLTSAPTPAPSGARREPRRVPRTLMIEPPTSRERTASSTGRAAVSTPAIVASGRASASTVPTPARAVGCVARDTRAGPAYDAGVAAFPRAVLRRSGDRYVVQVYGA